MSKVNMPSKNIPDFPSNKLSDRVAKNSGIEKQPVKPVARARVRKPSFVDNIFSPGANSVGHYILYDILLPAAKATFQEMISTGIEMLLYGDSPGPRRRRDHGGGMPRVSYANYYDRRDPAQHSPYNNTPTQRGRMRYEDVVFTNGEEAADVLSAMIEMLEQYRFVTIADFYELANVPGGTHVDNNWGWNDLSTARATWTRGGYAILLPRPIQIID